jgi:hypothetical protein
MVRRSRRVRAFVSMSLLGLLAAGCGGGGDATPGQPGRVALAVDTTVLQPDPTAPVPAVDLARFGSPRVAAVHRVTTPPDTPFRFDLVTWQEGSQGSVMVSLGHAADGESTPSGGVESLAVAGLLPTGSGLSGSDVWISANGDGLARLTVQGSIERPQVLVAVGPEGDATLVSIELGERSIVNQAATTAPPHPSISARSTIYSSDAWNFGLPAIAVSGDRTSIVAYEGDRQAGMSFARYEMRMQHDRLTGAVTGGGSVQAGNDLGNWRNCEVGALYNVLAVARSEPDQAFLRLSFDRGATFGQELGFGVGQGQTHLAQLAIAANYTIALAYWQTAWSGELQLMLVEGWPTATDPNGSPLVYQFQAPIVLRSMPAASTPLTTGIAWSSGGDLVVGYAASTWASAGMGWSSTTEFRCMSRPWGGAMHDVLVDSEQVFGRDPSVAVLGSGSSMQVFYAYEVQDGVRLATSSDGGATFALGPTFGAPGAHLPSVFARARNGATKVDVLYLASAANGNELHHARWADFGVSAREDFRITGASMVPTPPQGPRIGGNGMTPPFDYGWRSTQVSWLGYDAALDGDQIVAVVDEVTFDEAFVCLAMFQGFFGQSSTTAGSLPPIFQSASPPPLAPGMTQALPAVDPAHSHQLQIVRID